ncbi:MAG: phosphoribosylformylglycinamidine cyclo-ligase [Blastocatellia bacterium]|nr:phosphoribosylformylglycinamidine cyclo-ligase [Blastocatellia bacterium]MCS7156222.1 phosphoribosylformylglycinamidine cyclo-ligase [Blastocatellia bacterium]MCX7751428.1 phosphoribosylformylglycinamidine cyclo-ligase [Blastocatellia bacterium]MDW8169141.1 phosphoribosylformylglycinamidine cyclo-ligase [Acidobacteriota bacterium]MDW8256002.1 phosphoribosylformylglycinamidine cyclo-ligase [Acidobacteriota bacterium]
MRRITYREAGVDIEAARTAKEAIKQLARTTFTPEVLMDIGGFGALFRADLSAYRDPVLVSSVDGVGTKLKVAALAGRHDSVGYDIVAHCVNDILVHGARPLFFLDYIAMGKLVPDVVTQIVEGIVRGCLESGCALVGGETAEMPGVYAPGEYDLVGFIVGVVERERLLDGRRIEPGDVVLGLPSLGLHTNGYSLARKLFFEVAGWTLDTYVEELGGTVGDELLKPHRNYLPVLISLVERGLVKGLVHITGGGFLENIPRLLPEGCAVEIQEGGWPILPVFRLLQRLGNIEPQEMYRTFNMGIGMMAIVAAEDVLTVLDDLRRREEPGYVIGRVTAGARDVVISVP